MIPIFFQQIVGTFVRAALVFASGWMAAHGGPSYTDDQLAKAVTSVTPVVVAVAWSIWQKYRARQKQLTAAAIGPASENLVALLVGAGQAPSVLSPQHEPPTLTPVVSPTKGAEP